MVDKPSRNEAEHQQNTLSKFFFIILFMGLVLLAGLE
jgi:hypothetical protein